MGSTVKALARSDIIKNLTGHKDTETLGSYSGNNQLAFQTSPWHQMSYPKHQYLQTPSQQFHPELMGMTGDALCVTWRWSLSKSHSHSISLQLHTACYLVQKGALRCTEEEQHSPATSLRHSWYINQIAPKTIHHDDCDQLARNCVRTV